MWKEFRPAIRFLLIFVGLYLAGNILYGIWVASFDGLPDWATALVTRQTSWLLNVLGYQTAALESSQGPTVFLSNEHKVILNVYEGCNGVNVMVVFVAFLFAFGVSKKLIWFLPLGLVVIHLSNLIRILLLYFVAVGYHRYFYYVHKYIFTAALYAIVFVLWIIWVAINGKQKQPTTA